MTPTSRRTALALAFVVATLALGACSRPSTDAAPPTNAAATNALAEALPDANADTAPAPTAVAADAKPTLDTALPNDVISEVDNAPGPTGIDPRAMAGRFSGGGSALTLVADGTYALTEAGRTSSGTWTGEQNGRELLLDPDGKVDADRRYQRIDNDNLRSADTVGVALRRDGVVAP